MLSLISQVRTRTTPDNGTTPFRTSSKLAASHDEEEPGPESSASHDAGEPAAADDDCSSGSSSDPPQSAMVVLESTKDDSEQKLSSTRAAAVPRRRRCSSNGNDKLDKTMKLTDLERHCILGIGGFSHVWLVQHKVRGTVYALKTIDKSQVIQKNSISKIMREKTIMASLNHPFVVDLVSTFQDQHWLYLLESYIPGGELFSVIHDNDTGTSGLSHGAARFYGACIWEALSHLHAKKIIYRDLKPENVLLDAQGYCVLIDFGHSKEMNSAWWQMGVASERTKTPCGTPEYMAPEMILSKPYGKCVDIWSFGCFLYEMLVGQTPFVNTSDVSDKNSPMPLLKKIIKCKYAFPGPDHTKYVEPDAQDVIRKMLQKDPYKRLGAHTDRGTGIRTHPWFNEDIDWKDLLQKKLDAPYVPPVECAEDSSNFQSYCSAEREHEPHRDEDRRELTADEQAVFSEFC